MRMYVCVCVCEREIGICVVRDCVRMSVFKCVCQSAHALSCTYRIAT